VISCNAGNVRRRGKQKLDRPIILQGRSPASAAISTSPGAGRRFLPDLCGETLRPMRRSHLAGRPAAAAKGATEVISRQ